MADMKEIVAALKQAVTEALAEQNARTLEQQTADDAEKEAEEAKRREADRKHTREYISDTLPRGYVDRAHRVIDQDPHKGVGLVAGRMLRAYAAAKCFGTTPMEIAKSWGDPWLATMIEEGREKSLVAGTFTAGGALIPEALAAEMIDLLSNTSVMRKIGCDQMSMPLGHINMSRETSGPTASYVGEASNSNSSQGAFDQLSLSSKTLRTIVPISNALLIVPDAKADMRVRNAAVRAQGLREDLAFLRGDGTANTPKGVRNLIATANAFAATGTSLATQNTDLHKATRLVKSANVPIEKPAWVMSSRSLNNLSSMRGTDVWAWKPELDTGKLLRAPYYESNQVPDNLGGSSNASEVYFLEATQCVVADQLLMQVGVLEYAAYYDGSAVQSGLSRDETVIHLTSMHDFGMYHSLGGSVITGVTWGA